MSRFARTVRIDAPAPVVWAVLMDLEAWPTWAPQFQRIRRLDAGPLKLGSRVDVRPKAMPGAVWRITEFEDGRLFTWATSLAPGLRIVGGHELATDDESTRATFWLEADGLLGRLLAPLLRRALFSRNTRTASEGLKREVERRPGAAGGST